MNDWNIPKMATIYASSFRAREQRDRDPESIRPNQRHVDSSLRWNDGNIELLSLVKHQHTSLVDRFSHSFTFRQS